MAVKQVRPRKTTSRILSRHGLRPVLFLQGTMLLASALMMLPPMLVDLWYRNADWLAFALAGAISLLGGGLLVWRNAGGLRHGLTLRQAFLLTPTSWIAVAGVGALPFWLAEYGSVSGNWRMRCSSLFRASPRPGPR